MASLRSYLGFSLAEALQTSQGETCFIACRTSKSYELCVWFMVSWNVRSRIFVNVEGSIETARRSCDDSVIDEWKIDQVISEVSVAALQETRWFGKNIYRVGSSVVLSALRDIPDAGQTRHRGEGVVLVLSGKAVNAWKAGDIVSGRLGARGWSLDGCMYYLAMLLLLLRLEKKTSFVTIFRLHSHHFHLMNVCDAG